MLDMYIKIKKKNLKIRTLCHGQHHLPSWSKLKPDQKKKGIQYSTLILI